MSLKIEVARNPVWANVEQTAINLNVKFAEFVNALPFTARADDIEPHGPELFASAIAGEFGPIAEYVAPPPFVPQVVSKFQGRAALAQAGLLVDVDAYMQAQPAENIARLAWEHAQEFRRQSPSVVAIGSALGLSDNDLDQLFVTAATIQA
jgi:hypothetical protein